MTPEALERRRLRHREINQRPKRCPQCAETVQAGNLARHLRRMCRMFGGKRAA